LVEQLVALLNMPLSGAFGCTRTAREDISNQ
jgi:hypothetical protein